MTDDEYVPGTLVPISLCPLIGQFVVQFSALDRELNTLIWHLNGSGPIKGRAVTASIINYHPRRQLMEWLASTVEDEKDRKKLIKLSAKYREVADYRHRILHDEVGYHSPSSGSVGLWRSESQLQPKKPTEVSAESLTYYIRLTFELSARMQQYVTGNANWTEKDEHFPWHGKPAQKPRTTSRP